MNNRGVSPLVATLILILISAGLGGMVMAYGESYIEERAEFVGRAYETEASCGDVALNFVDIDGDPHVCINPEARTVKMFVESGRADVPSSKLKLVGSDDIFTKDISTKIAKGDTEKLEVSYTNIGEVKQIKLTPYAGTQACSSITVSAPIQVC